MNTHKNSALKTFFSSEQIRSTALVWVLVAGVCAVLANVIAASFIQVL